MSGIGACTDRLDIGPGCFQTDAMVLVGVSGNHPTRARVKWAMLILQPITGWYSIYGVAQHGIDIRIDLVRQVWR